MQKLYPENSQTLGQFSRFASAGANEKKYIPPLTMLENTQLFFIALGIG